jgi:hypothetical protein
MIGSDPIVKGANISSIKNLIEDQGKKYHWKTFSWQVNARALTFLPHLG